MRRVQKLQLELWHLVFLCAVVFWHGVFWNYLVVRQTRHGAVKSRPAHYHFSSEAVNVRSECFQLLQDRGLTAIAIWLLSIVQYFFCIDMVRFIPVMYREIKPCDALSWGSRSCSCSCLLHWNWIEYSKCIEVFILQNISTSWRMPSAGMLMSILTRTTRRDIPEDGIFHSHRRENLKSYRALTGWDL
jgi:hypothetical protein